MTKSLLCLAVLTFAASAQAQLAVTQREPGVHQEQGALKDGTKVRYTVSVPKGYAPGKSHPLVLALHYGGEVTPFYGRGLIEALVGPGLAELKAIVVAPDSLGDGWQGGNDERYVLALLDAVQRAYAVDAKRVIVTGFSMGGAGAWYFASKHPKRFSAVVPVAGRPVGDGLEIPIYAIHSRADTVVPFPPAEARLKALKAKGHNAVFVALDDLEHYAVPAYAEHLSQAVPWIRKVWKAKAKAKD